MVKLDERTELGIEMLYAFEEANFERIEEIVKTGIRSLDKVTEVEGWSWLHKVLRGATQNLPPPKSIQYLIDNGNNVNAQDNYGMTPLHYAMRSKNIEVIKLLLEEGADPNTENEKHLTPLNYINGIPEELDLLELMLKKGANPNHSNGQHGILEGIKKYRGDEPEFIPVIEMMEKYV